MSKTQISNIEIIKELNDRELLRPLVMAGLIKPSIIRDLEVFYDVDRQVKTGQHKEMAVRLTAGKFGICRKTVYNAISSLV
jgi:hypothetical protein